MVLQYQGNVEEFMKAVIDPIADVKTHHPVVEITSLARLSRASVCI